MRNVLAGFGILLLTLIRADAGCYTPPPPPPAPPPGPSGPATPTDPADPDGPTTSGPGTPTTPGHPATTTPSDAPPAPPPVPQSTPADTPVKPGNMPLTPGARVPTDTVTPSDSTPPTTPPTEPDNQAPTTTPRAPATPPDRGPRPSKPTHARPSSVRTSKSRGRRTQSAPSNGWQHWWNFNREQFIDLRGRLRGKGPASGSGSVAAKAARSDRRTEVRTALRRVILTSKDESVRANCLLALGRMGDDDANLMLHVLRDAGSADETREAAALAIGLLPEIDDSATRVRVRRHFDYWLGGHGDLPAQTRPLVAISAGLRARHDALLMMGLGFKLDQSGRDRELTAALMIGCGLAGDRMLVPELIRATRKNRATDRAEFEDCLRGHAATALGRTGDPSATKTLMAVLRSRRAGSQAKRAAALALGRLLRLRVVPDGDLRSALALLRRTAERGRDSELRGFALLALAECHQRDFTQELMKTLGSGGNNDVRPYAALALGIRGRSLGSEMAKPIARFLAEELSKARHASLEASICLALGMVRASEAREVLLDRVENQNAPLIVRSHATQAVGLLGRPTPRANQVLEGLVRSGSNELAGDAALSLGLLGRRSVARRLVRNLEAAPSSRAQGMVTLALGHFANEATSGALVTILTRQGARVPTRESAATALGLMYDTREQDILFGIPADMNFHGTTRATYRLLVMN